MDAVEDERTGTPPDGDSPEDRPAEHEVRPEQDNPVAADPRTTIAGRYSLDLQSVPGNAGIAVAYEGRDLRTREPVLIKTLRLEYRGDPEMRARFRREARLLQFLSHPNVIRALTFSEERGAPWLILERVPGRSLREEIAISAPFSPEEVLPLLQGLAAALDHLHARGLVHLDVRPENVMVTPDGQAKLVDFGIAQTAGTFQAPLDGGGNAVIDYLAPEQLRGEPISTTSDVFALGSIVYEMLTGKPPFLPEKGPDSRNSAIRARLDQPLIPPTTARGDDALPPWVDGVVQGALEREPRQRYGSAGSFAAVFHSGVEGDVDVETGRPRMPIQEQRPRYVPINEPGIAVKGSSALAARRSESPGQEVIDAAFSPVVPPKPVAYRNPSPRFLAGLDFDLLVLRLWQAVILALVLNLILMGTLLATRGELPGVWHATAEIGPGATVRVAGTGLVVRDAPQSNAAIATDLPEGGIVRITGEPVSGDGGLWWPVEVETANGPGSGYIPESWIQQP